MRAIDGLPGVKGAFFIRAAAIEETYGLLYAFPQR